MCTDTCRSKKCISKVKINGACVQKPGRLSACTRALRRCWTHLQQCTKHPKDITLVPGVHRAYQHNLTD